MFPTRLLKSTEISSPLTHTVIFSGVLSEKTYRTLESSLKPFKHMFVLEKATLFGLHKTAICRGVCHGFDLALEEYNQKFGTEFESHGALNFKESHYYGLVFPREIFGQFDKIEQWDFSQTTE